MVMDASTWRVLLLLLVSCVSEGEGGGGGGGGQPSYPHSRDSPKIRGIDLVICLLQQSVCGSGVGG